MSGLLLAKKPTLAIVKTRKSKEFLDKHFESHSNFLFTRTLDLKEENSVKEICRLIHETNLRPSALINNARDPEAVNTYGKKSLTKEQFFNQYIFDVWLPYSISTTLVRKHSSMKRIINISSQYGLVATNPSLYDDSRLIPINYSAAKAAMNQLTRELAVTFSSKEITVNAVAYGGIEGRASDGFKKRYKSFNPMGRMIKKAEIYTAIDFLLRENSSGITGQILSVDNGWTIW